MKPLSPGLCSAQPGHWSRCLCRQLGLSEHGRPPPHSQTALGPLCSLLCALTCVDRHRQPTDAGSEPGGLGRLNRSASSLAPRGGRHCELSTRPRRRLRAPSWCRLTGGEPCPLSGPSTAGPSTRAPCSKQGHSTSMTEPTGPPPSAASKSRAPRRVPAKKPLSIRGVGRCGCSVCFSPHSAVWHREGPAHPSRAMPAWTSYLTPGFCLLLCGMGSWGCSGEHICTAPSGGAVRCA